MAVYKIKHHPHFSTHFSHTNVHGLATPLWPLLRDSAVSPHPIYSMILFSILQPDKVLYWLQELLSGLLFLEKNCVVHRDLKMENLLLSQDGKLVIADFGKAILLDDNFKIPYVQGIYKL